MAPNKNKKTAPKNKKKDFAQKYAFWIVFAVILIAAIVIVALKLIAPPTPSESDKSDTSSSDNKPTNSAALDNSDVTSEKPEETKTEEAKPEDTTTDKTPAQYEGTNPNTLKELTGSITYKGYVNNSYTVRINIDQSIGETGTCAITMQPSTGSPYRKTVRTRGEPHTATCDGFDVGINDLRYGETYDVTIIISAEDKTLTLRDKVTIPAKTTESEEPAEE